MIQNKSGKKTSFISHLLGFISVLSPIRDQLAPAVQVFCRFGAADRAEALKRKPSALFPAG